MSKIFERYIHPGFVFAGGTIGVGFLSLPYIASRVGIGIFFIYFLIISFITVMLNLAFCDVSLKTPDFKRFPGFVEKYFGKKTKFLSTILLLIAGFGILLAYLIVGGQFFASLFQKYLGGSQMIYTFIYFGIACLAVLFNFKVISRVIFFILGFLALSLCLIFLKGFFYIQPSNFQFISPNFQNNWFLPFGPILFSLWGAGFVPQVEEMIKKSKNSLKKIILISTIAVAIFYFLFTLLILGISGIKTTQTALPGLAKFFDGIVFIALLAGSAAILNAFIAQSNILKEALIYDLKINRKQAFVMICFTPMILFLLGFNAFIGIISFIGGVIISIFGIIIMLMYRKIGGMNIITYPLILIFVFSIVYQIFYFLWLGIS